MSHEFLAQKTIRLIDNMTNSLNFISLSISRLATRDPVKGKSK